MLSKVLHLIFAIVVAAALSGCDDTPTRPSTGALVTFQVGSEVFSAWLQTDAQIAAARAAQAGGAARIPNGRLVSGTEFNTGYSWHLEDVEFAEAAIELCDGLPSEVERQGVTFGGGRYCPWSARVTRIDEEP